jgi:hypothetical protein
MATLEAELAAARERLGYGTAHVFKHTSARDITHHHFYAALANVPRLCAHVYEYPKLDWSPQFAAPACGDHCICDAFVTLTLRLPSELVEKQTLYIDYPRRERAIVVAFATTLRNSMKGTRQRSFAKIQPRPDDRHEGGIIQVADMIAGEVRQHAGIGGPYLSALGARVRIV